MDGICLSVDSSPANVLEEINSSVVSANPRELLLSIYRSLRTAGMANLDPDRELIVNVLNDAAVGEQTIRQLIPSEHAGVEYEIIGLQKEFFDSIETEIVEAVKYLPWENSHDPGIYRAFVKGFEKTTSGNLYKIGSRGITAGIHRLLFDKKFGVGIAGGISSLETINERVNEKTDGFQSALYAKYKSGKVVATTIASFGMHDYDSSRVSAFGTTIRGKTDIKVYGAKISGGLHLLDNLPVRIRPGISFSFTKASTGSYTETGGGLDILLKDSSMTSSEAGAKINLSFNALKTVLSTVVQPELEAGVFYDFSSSGNNLDARVFNTDFTVFRSQVSDEFRYFVGGQLVLSDNKNLAFKIGYKVDSWNNMRSHTGTGQFHIRF